jgi:cwf21 domain
LFLERKKSLIATMSSNVGLSTPRGSGTSGYVQRNLSFLKPRSAGFGAPYPPLLSAGGAGAGPSSFRQRKPDRQILEHDRKRAVEVQVVEEQDRLEEENERIRERGEQQHILSAEEIEQRCAALRQRLLRELEQHDDDDEDGRHPRRRDPVRRQFKSYQVHELAEAKIIESERMRKALWIKEDWERSSSSSSTTPPAPPAAVAEKDNDEQRRSGRSRLSGKSY